MAAIHGMCSLKLMPGSSRIGDGMKQTMNDRRRTRGHCLAAVNFYLDELSVWCMLALFSGLETAT